MIRLHRLHSNEEFVISADLIETMESRPDTTIQLLSGRRFVVADSLDEVIAKVVEFRAQAGGNFVPAMRTLNSDGGTTDTRAA